MAFNPSEFIKLRIDHNVTYLDGRLSSDIYKNFRKELGYRPENAFFMIRSVIEKEEEKAERN